MQWFGRSATGKPGIGWPTWVVIGLMVIADLIVLVNVIQAPFGAKSPTYILLRCALLVGVTRCIVWLYFWLPGYDPKPDPGDA